MSAAPGPVITPAEYLVRIVLPTLGELLAEPVDQRRAYLACITAAHLVDHVATTLERRPDGRLDVRAVRAAVGRLGPYPAACLAIVEAVCNGTKHALPDPKPNRPVKFAPGYERPVPAFSFDVEGAGWDEGRWDGPGLVVDHDGRHWFIDDCVKAMVRACAAAFPDLFIDANLIAVARDAVARDPDQYAFLDALAAAAGLAP